MSLVIENAQFTELTSHNPKVSALLSPKGHAVANASQCELEIWNLESREISNKFVCNSLLDFIKWSPDSELICCGKLKESIQVWNLEMPHWRCKIAGSLGFSNVYWAPDSQHLIVVSEFFIKATVFSLVSSASTVAEIDNPTPVENGIIFSPCTKYLAVAQRLNCKDYLGIYSCETWETIKIFQVDAKNVASISFSPTDLVIAILDSAVEYRVLFYSIDGRLLGKFVNETYFGLLTLSWSFRKNLIALGDYQSEIKILDGFNYEILTSYLHSDVIESADIIVYKVKENLPEIKSPHVAAFSSYFELDDVVKERPVLLICTPDNEKEKMKNPLKSGVQILQFSHDGKYIATVDGNFPKVVFVFDTEKFKICSVVVRGSSVKSICWHSVKPYLIICSSNNVVDIWTPECCIRNIPSFTVDFPVLNAAWSPKNNCILLNSKDQFSILYFEPFS